MLRNTLAAIAIIAAIVSIGSGAWPLPDFGIADKETPESITLGTPPNELASLIFIAEDQGFFAGNNINATIRTYDTALAAVGGMKKGDVDFSVSTEYPIVAEAFNNGNIGVIGSIDKYETTYLIGRKDLGIENLRDLKGKKIGLGRGGIGEFYLGRFLDLHGMSIHDVTLVDIKPAQLMASLANGSVDAAMIWNIDINTVEKRLNSNAIVWPAQSSQTAFSVVTCRKEWAASHPDAIARFLKSLAQAEQYTINHPAEAKAIVQKRLNYTDAYAAPIWPNHQFSLTLDQSLVAAMEDEARWMIQNNLTAGKTVPDFGQNIYTKGLREVKPDSVNI